MSDDTLTASILRQLFRYSPETGEFFWIVPRKGRKLGARAGGIDLGGHRVIGIDGKLYRAARLAFLYMTGEWPKNHVDHINGIRDDDSWANLRDVTNKENARNARTGSNNSSGHIGVSRHPMSTKWRAHIKVDGRQIHLGMWDSFADAVNARKAAEQKYGFHRNHGRQVYTPEMV